MQAREASWEVVERLVDEQKFREAVALVAELRERAAARGAEEEWTRSLVRETQLHIALHGYERAVKVLSETPWPAGRRYRVALHLCRGKALLEYLRVYRWEIARREPVGGEGPKDLALWTAEEFFQEALREYLAAWEERGPLGNEPGTALALLLEANNYPPGIRSTLRDTVSYLLVDLLADSSLWRPEQGNELYRLDLTALLGPPAAVTQSTALADPQRHPLAKAVEVLGDLEAWHAAAGREEAALEDRLERFRLLHRALTQEEDRLAIRQALEGVLAARQHLGWWAVGQALLVEMVANEEKPDAILRARELAREGYRKDPKGVGGQRCRNFLESTERPEFELEGMLSDGPARPSLGVVHRNVRELYLRAYRLNQQEMIDHTTRLLFQFQAESPVVDRLLARPKADAAWRVELPQTGDFRSHRTFVTPPPLAPGAYAVVASLREDFAREGNQLAAVTLIQSELVLLARGERDGSVVVTVVEGSLGKPAADVKVTLYEYDWHRSQKRQVERWTGADGVVRFAASEMEGDRQYFLLAQRGEQRTVLVEPLRSSRRQQRGRETHAVVYTDRSVYRPGQTVHFKVVVFGGVLAEGGFRTRSNQPVTVSLRDANGETVASTRCRTNAFGSCWGEFTIPTGRLLGRWRVEATGGGAATIHVEEYKRPTFEVVFLDPAEPLRLNRPARLSGEARYYFGLPVREGKVQWRVFREPEPLRWWWDWRPPDREERLVASGEAELSAAGTFSLEFVPAADEREAKNPDVSYRFRIEADVTDPGGETRTAQRSVRLAFVAVAADIDLELGFLREGVARAVSIRRTSLEGVGQKGVGRYRLVRLHHPERVLLPAEQPISPQQEDPFATPGDRTRPRWNHAYAPARVLHAWPDGETLAGGQLVHDEGGMATVTLPRLSAGCYRLRYETVDSFGAVFETAREFVVGGVKTPIALPAALFVDRSAVEVGDSLGVLVVSGLPGQHLVLEIRRQGGRVEVRRLVAGRDASLLELAIGPEDRGGIGLRLWAVRDYQLMVLEKQVPVPWTDRKLQLSFATFRDSLRPGRHESFRVKVADASGRPVGVAAAEVLAYMYDRSVDLFAPHLPPSPLDAYPTHIAMGWRHANLRETRPWWQQDSVPWPAPAPELVPDRLKWLSGYGVGGPGRRYPVSRMAEREGMVVREVAEAYVLRDEAAKRPGVEADAVPVPTAPPQAQVAEGVGEERTLRSNFAETAFFLPALLTGEDGSVTIEFEVPDAVTAWNVWLHAITQDLRAGLLRGETRTVKELLVRPYLPRFFREGDEVRPKVVVNNTSGRELEGKLSVRIADAESGEDLAEAFGLDPSWRAGRPFRVAAGGGTALEFDVTVPRRVGAAVVTVTAATADFADGEARGVPILPARLHLSQSRFVALPEGSEKRLHFPDMAASDDPSRESESLVVTVDAQLFYAALAALPYLVEYPYECTEQILNRFLSTSILTSLFSAHPEVARMAEQLSQRETRYEAWERDDPNRRMALEETPWLVLSQGGKDEAPLLKVLDPRVAEQERQRALAQLEKAQTASGGFPWWPGGPPSPYMTLYLMYGFAKAAEFGVPVPQGVVERGWQYLGSYFREQYAARQYASKLMELDCCWEFLTFLNYVASCYGHGEWMEAALPSEERQQILDFSFRHWREHSPYLKSMLALTLARMGRPGDARLVFDSVMDSATTTENEGTFWAPEERSWLWYNDTIEGHAVALRTLVELSPGDARVAGLVHWLLLNRKTNHWHSTKATAEVLYALAKVLQAEGKLAVREEVAVQAGPHGARFVFEPDRFTGAGNRLVVPGEAVGPATATVEAANRGQGLAFVSATWHFATSRPPLEGRGDVLTVSREFYKRVVQGKGFTLVPLASGDRVEVGDEVEVRLVVRSRFPMEFVHLRDPRPAGCEPVVPTSSFKWDRGIVRYEEVRDSGINFFFENLPYGEFAFAHRLRAVTAGSFQVGPAVIQSMYAPEFVAYSAGSSLRVVQAP
ncbi:MAG: hypothetical protein HXY19_03960 [Thermoanaerobaculaceae bacterium]|nr:hypothetical protein [Thermoanaerobaculaceae bacterium]